MCLLADLTRHPRIQDRVDRPRPVGLESDRDRVRPARVEEVGQRLDAVVDDPGVRIDA